MRKIFIISNIIVLPNPIAVGLSFAVFPNVKNNKISKISSVVITVFIISIGSLLWHIIQIYFTD